MHLDNGAGLRATLEKVNRARLDLPVDWSPAALAAAEEVVAGVFGAAARLAIYGTLAPGKVNHHHIADLGGDWQDAAVRGRLDRVGHGIHRGLPAIVLDPAAPPHALKLLVCQGLPAAWARLDTFEGEEMQRLLVPLEGADGVTGVAGVANIYALRRAMIEALG